MLEIPILENDVKDKMTQRRMLLALKQIMLRRKKRNNSIQLMDVFLFSYDSCSLCDNKSTVQMLL